MVRVSTCLKNANGAGDERMPQVSHPARAPFTFLAVSHAPNLPPVRPAVRCPTPPSACHHAEQQHGSSTHQRGAVPAAVHESAKHQPGERWQTTCPAPNTPARTRPVAPLGVAFLIIMSRDGPPIPTAKPVAASTTMLRVGPNRPVATQRQQHRSSRHGHRHHPVRCGVNGRPQSHRPTCQRAAQHM